MKRQKKGDRVLMGKIATGTYQGSENRIPLFDGKFTTGYMITRLEIASTDPHDDEEINLKVSTEPKSNISEWNWSDVQEVGWAGWNIPNAVNGVFYHSIIRPGTMVIEDLYISAYTPTGEGAEINYLIELEKFTFTDWDGAGILVGNLSQAGPQ
mgnify:FL=1|tara:strand:- start:90 stop:551 length:462 start_codon:yes stop_codon:yes gene_type:complete